MKIVAIIPAAGSGSRLASARPKILTQLTKTETIWSILRRKLLTVVEHINIIVSPVGEPMVREVMQEDIANNFVSLNCQTKPIGMGDAVFCGYPVWSQADVILIIWGDQLFVSKDTLKRSLTTHAGAVKTVSLPLTTVSNPYVEYIFDHDKLISVKQSREGDQLSSKGLADVGTFVLSVQDLLQEWLAYRTHQNVGAETGEINFLPFLPWLSLRNWTVKTVPVANVTESRGINTPDDLFFFKKIYEVPE